MNPAHRCTIEAHARIRTVITHLERDREPGPDLAAGTALVHRGRLADLAEPNPA